jgi:hypothetical protein
MLKSIMSSEYAPANQLPPSIDDDGGGIAEIYASLRLDQQAALLSLAKCMAEQND